MVVVWIVLDNSLNQQSSQFSFQTFVFFLFRMFLMFISVFLLQGMDQITPSFTREMQSITVFHMEMQLMYVSLQFHQTSRDASIYKCFFWKKGMSPCKFVHLKAWETLFTRITFSPSILFLQMILTHFIGHYVAPIHMFGDTQLPCLYALNPIEGNNVCIDICFYFLVYNT